MTATWTQLTILLAGFALSGCRSVVDFNALDLPDELRSLATDPPRQVDLSSVARHAIHQNVVYPGDVLEVTVATGMEDHEPPTWPLRISEQGSVDVPLVGEVMVAGLGLVEVEQAIARAAEEREVYRRPHVAVLMKQRKTVQVRVVGAVKTPGVYQLPAAGGDLLAALVAAGGLNEEAGTEIEIRHPNRRLVGTPGTGPEGVALASFVSSTEEPPRIVRLDLAEIPQAEPDIDLHIEDGSVVMVHTREKRSVSVIGLVRRPDNYELPTEESLRLLDALALAGGPTVSVADKVRVIRHPPDREDPVTIAVSIRRAKRLGKENLLLAPGDIVVVEETPTTVVVETIRGFIRFGFTSAIPGL